MPKMVKIGPAGPARQRGEMWRSNAVIFYLFFFTFYQISCPPLETTFCTYNPCCHIIL